MSGSKATIRLPLFSGNFASSKAVKAAAPEEITETEEAVPAEETPAEEAVVPAEETTTEEVVIAEETEEEKLAAGDDLVNVADGFLNKDGKNYYYKDNVALTGLQTIEEKQYYFGEDGAMLTGYQFIKEKNKSYFFNEAEKAEDCYAVTDEWKTVDGKKYYFKPNGQAEVGVKTVGNDLYYLNRPAGDAAVGLQVINGRTFFFDSRTIPRTNTADVSRTSPSGIIPISAAAVLSTDSFIVESARES